VNLTFELGITLGEIAKVRFEDAPVPKLDDPHTWFIRLGGEAVTIHARREGRVREIGQASWVRDRLIERTGVPSDQQWKTIGTALGRVIRRAKPSDAPLWRRVPRTVIGPIVMGVLAIAATAVIFTVRTKEPARATIAPYDKMTWRDVEHGGETTPALVVKDPARERHRRGDRARDRRRARGPRGQAAYTRGRHAVVHRASQHALDRHALRRSVLRLRA
jgi:hypothetical protein